jgi:serine/threonine protein kinase
MTTLRVAPGQELAGYRIDGPIGQGDSGAAYRAFDLELKRTVVLKLLGSGAATAAQLAHFEHEAMALAKLVHPNIVPVLDCGVSESTPFLTMELLDGQTLTRALGTGLFSRERAERIVRELLAALAFMHGRGLPHRDLSTDNIVLQQLPNHEERLKLLIGTRTCLPPEHATRDELGPSADVYSAAAVCFEVLTGRKLYENQGQSPLVHEACATRVAQPELERALQRALRRLATERQPSAVELEAQLKAVPQPWLYEGRDVTKARRKAAEAARDALNVSAASALTRTVKPTAEAEQPIPTELLPRLARFGAWTFSIASLIVVGVAATAIYLLKDTTLPQALDFLERALPEVTSAPAPEPEPKIGLEVSADASVAAERQPAELEPALVARAPRAAPINPWKTAPIPRELREMRWKIEIGQPGDREMLKDLKRYIRRNPKDVRGPLLLARLYTNRDEWNDAIAQYRLAYDLDSSSRGDPRMLKDLVSAVARKESSWRASALIPAVYGAAALEDIQRAIKRTHDNEERLRLEQLAHTLGR